MSLQISVRIDDDLSEHVSDVAKRLHVRRSDIVRMALEEFVQRVETAPAELSFYDRISHMVGVADSGLDDLGTNHSRHMAKKLKAR